MLGASGIELGCFGHAGIDSAEERAIVPSNGGSAEEVGAAICITIAARLPIRKAGFIKLKYPFSQLLLRTAQWRTHELRPQAGHGTIYLVDKMPLERLARSIIRLPDIGVSRSRSQTAAWDQRL